MGKKGHRKIARRLLQAFLAFVAVVILILWQLDRGVPRFVRVRMERALSRGRYSVRFDHASISLFHGVTVRNLRVHVKKEIGPPLITVGELRLKGNFYFDRPIYTWIRSVEADDFVCRPFRKLPVSERGMTFAAFLQYCTVENDWYSEPIYFSLRNADIFAIKSRKADFQLHAKNKLVTIDAIRLDLFSRGFDESVTGWTTFTPPPSEIHSRLQGVLTPEVLEDFFEFLGILAVNRIAHRIDDYTAPPQVGFEISWKSSPEKDVPATYDIQTTILGGGLTYRGVPLRDLRFGLHWSSRPDHGQRKRHLAVGPIEIAFADGTATLNVDWNPDAHATDIRAEANARPEDLARAIWGKVPTILTNFTFQTIPAISAAGRIMPADSVEKTSFAGAAKVESAVARGIPLQDVSFDFRLHGDNIIDFTNVTARVFDGDLEGLVRVSNYGSAGSAPNMDLNFLLLGADCLKVRRHFFQRDLEGGGRLSAKIDLHGLADSEMLDTLHGSAGLMIRGGNLLRIPLFAGLTDFIARNVPGIDLLVMQSDADVGCTLTNGLINIDNVTVSGNLFSLVAAGRCRINKEKLPIDMVAQLRFFHSQSLIGRLARWVSLPVSKMMEFRVTGPVAKPEWSYIGIIDRIKGLFWTREDATALQEEAPKPNDEAGEGSK